MHMAAIFGMAMPRHGATNASRATSGASMECNGARGVRGLIHWRCLHLELSRMGASAIVFKVISKWTSLETWLTACAMIHCRAGILLLHGIQASLTRCRCRLDSMQ